MNTKRNWKELTVVVVLALASLSSVAVSAPAPYPSRLNIMADVCGEVYASEWDQYSAASEWAEGSDEETPLALTVGCDAESAGLEASAAGQGGDSLAIFEQYKAAIEGRELDVNAASAAPMAESQARFEQYMAAIQATEEVSVVASSTGGNDQAEFGQFFASLGGSGSVPFASPAPIGGNSAELFEQYMAAIEGTEQVVNAAPVHTATGNSAHFDQYTAAIEWAERGGQVPQALTVSGGEKSLDLAASTAGQGGDSLVIFDQYMSAIEAAEPSELSRAITVLRSVRVPTFAPEPSTGENKLEYVPRRGPTFAPEPPTGENKQFELGRATKTVVRSRTSKAPLKDESNPVALELRGWEWAAAPVPQNEISQSAVAEYFAALELRGWEWAAAPVPEK